MKNGVGVLESWLGVKDMSRYHGHLLDIGVSIEMIYPNLTIINKYERIERKYLSLESSKQVHEYYYLYKLLLRSMTKLHYKNRVMVEDKLYVAREDVLLTLSLLQPLVWPLSLVGYRTKKIYRELISSFYPVDFSVRQAYHKLRIPRSSLQRHIGILEKCNYLERVGGDKKKGYQYNVGSRGLS